MKTIANTKLKVGINTKGAELASIINQSNGTELLWQADPAHWGRHSCILFPIIGKLKNGSYTHDQKSYALNQHGFVRNKEYELKEQTKDSLHFQYNSTEEDLLIYPYPFTSSIKYKIDDNLLSVQYEIVNTGNEKMYFSIGAHPGFTCPILPDKKRSDYSLVFNQDETAYSLGLDDSGLISDKKRMILNNSKVINIEDDLFDHDALIFHNLKSNEISLVDDEGRLVWTFDFTGFPYLGIWSKSQDSPFVCIEPWFGLADYHNATGILSEKTGIEKLEPAEHFSCVHRVTVQ